MSAPIDYAVLAELAEALDAPGAAHLRRSADAELVDEREDGVEAVEQVEALHELLDQVPEPAKSTKHGGECWKRHAHCLAERIRGGAQ